MNKCENWKKKFHDDLFESVVWNVVNDYYEFYNEADNEFSECFHNMMSDLKIYDTLYDVRECYDVNEVFDAGAHKFFNDQVFYYVFSGESNVDINIEVTVGQLLYAAVLRWIEGDAESSKFSIKEDIHSAKLLLDTADKWADVLKDANILNKKLSYHKSLKF